MLRKLNLSGHENDALTKMEFEFPGNLQVNLQDPELPAKIIDFLANDLRLSSDDQVLLVPPGLAPLAAIVIAACHGITGQFPSLQTMIRQADGAFTPGPVIDLQAVRELARPRRQNTISL